MSQFSPDFADKLWWSSRPNSTNKRLMIPQIDRHHNEQHHDECCIERESMFEKHLTPSDVGKLNRLVIPKQQAEKYFPLNNNNNNNNNSNNISHGSDKGLLLSFDDEVGQCWRFRYSYWSSSQSYVLTKGWNRYVKEKHLEAGDLIVLTPPPKIISVWISISVAVERRRWYIQVINLILHILSHTNLTVVMQAKATPVVNSKRLRLFGVNLDCQVEEEESEEPPTPDGSSTSSQGQQVHRQHRNIQVLLP